MKYKFLFLLAAATLFYSCQEDLKDTPLLESPKYQTSELAFIQSFSTPADSVTIFISQEIHTSVLGKKNTRKLNLVFKAYSDATAADEFFNKKSDLIKESVLKQVANSDQFEAIDLLMQKNKEVIAQKTIYLNNK